MAKKSDDEPPTFMGYSNRENNANANANDSSNANANAYAIPPVNTYLAMGNAAIEGANPARSEQTVQNNANDNANANASLNANANVNTTCVVRFVNADWTTGNMVTEGANPAGSEQTVQNNANDNDNANANANANASDNANTDNNANGNANADDPVNTDGVAGSVETEDTMPVESEQTTQNHSCSPALYPGDKKGIPVGPIYKESPFLREVYYWTNEANTRYLEMNAEPNTPVLQVSIRFRALLPSILKLTYYPVVGAHDIQALADAFDYLCKTFWFYRLPAEYPYKAEIITLRDRFTLLAQQRKTSAPMRFMLPEKNKYQILAILTETCQGGIPTMKYGEFAKEIMENRKEKTLNAINAIKEEVINDFNGNDNGDGNDNARPTRLFSAKEKKKYYLELQKKEARKHYRYSTT